MSAPRRLFRYPTAGRVAGVCAGIAEYLDTDVTLVRVAWIVLSIVPGGFVGGLIAYAAAWVLMPVSDAAIQTSIQKLQLTRSVTDRRVAGVCGGIAEYLEVDSTVVRVAWAILTLIPGCIVLGVFAYMVAWFIIPTKSTPEVVPAPTPA